MAIINNSLKPHRVTNNITTCLPGLCTDYKIKNQHTQHIRQYYRHLLEQLDVKHSGLLAELFAMNIIDQQDKEELESIESSISRIERLFSMLSKTSSDQWELFLVALDVTEQGHLADMIRGKRTADLQVS
jgi:Caspase recruitment domain